MNETFDVAIVGAGPAGVSAACVLAEAGVKTVVFERGEFPGAKNMSGGVLYGSELARILPDYAARGCPVERNIVESRMWFLTPDGGFSLGYRDAILETERKFNAFTVGRAKFDRWYAEQARKKGALIVPATVVMDFIRERGAVAGVVTDREDGDVRAGVVLLADGVNSPLAARTGFRPEIKPEQVALAVKEVIELPAEVIEQRFAVTGNNGVTTEILGAITEGMSGVGVLYTNINSISLAVGANLADFVKYKTKPYELIERFKRHPMIAPLIAGGKSLEYTAHWLPEGGYDAMPPLYGDGYLIAGDSAMLFNTPHREGSNLAMASGKMAAETIIEALGRKDFSRQGLAGYAERLAASYVLKDMKKYRRFGHFLYEHKEIFSRLPQAAGFAGREIITVDGVSKKEKQRRVWRNLRRTLTLRGLLRLAWAGWRAING
ncbi:MAG: FAD-dependent monooxygenase [Chloroflexi bacterium]|nr:FAD-dependent monooxygenase [Chloroflexota bacterium]